jgi:hypothetical protein
MELEASRIISSVTMQRAKRDYLIRLSHIGDALAVSLKVRACTAKTSGCLCHIDRFSDKRSMCQGCVGRKRVIRCHAMTIGQRLEQIGSRVTKMVVRQLRPNLVPEKILIGPHVHGPRQPPPRFDPPLNVSEDPSADAPHPAEDGRGDMLLVIVHGMQRCARFDPSGYGGGFAGIESRVAITHDAVFQAFCGGGPKPPE